MTNHRWEYGITHANEELDEFLVNFFEDSDRNIVLIAGAGFDPRSTIIAERLAGLKGVQLRAIFIRETRPDPDEKLVELAETHLETLTAVVPINRVVEVQIFGSDNSVIGGRRVAALLNANDFENATDVIVDVSALSVGISFPAIKFLHEAATKHNTGYNVHLFVVHQPELDALIKAEPTDTMTPVHGFNGGLSLTSQSQGSAKLWLPQLASGKGATLRVIHEKLAPDDVCPLVPFPASHPQQGDSLLEELLTSGGIPWDMDSRNVVHADEADPLDLYRTIMRLYDLREPVFKEFGGSKLVLSPVGSKVMALGALLAALERDLPVVYIEDYSYDLGEEASGNAGEPHLLHLWLDVAPSLQEA